MGFTTYTLADVTALRDALKTGTLRVQYQDKAITYRSVSEMMQVLRLMEQELGLKRRTSRVKAEFDKGLC